jgi:hypothetical protein
MKEKDTVGTVPKYDTVGTVLKYDTVGTVLKYATVGRNKIIHMTISVSRRLNFKIIAFFTVTLLGRLHVRVAFYSHVESTYYLKIRY